ncbi:MAG: ATP-dependent helicase [Patescibacteria group bacterium]
MEQNFKIDYQKELNSAQYEAVVKTDGPSLILAGAGSGKTRVLVYRTAYLLEKGIPPDNLMLVTFTNKAAKQMLGRIETLLQIKPQGLWGGTFHHLGNRILRMYGRHIGIDPNFNILDEQDAKDIVKSCGKAIRLPDDKRFPKTDVIRKIISLSINLDQSLTEIIASRFSHLPEEYCSTISQIAEIYQKKKQSANSLDFDDLLLKWNRLLEEKPEVRGKLSRQFEHILVDEYQDTNPVQSRIIANLAGKSQNVFVVGDDSQSIYSFRGADVGNILNFPKTFKESRIFKLETNYRSTPEILGLANSSIAYNKKQFKKVLHTHRESGEKPTLISLADAYQQAGFVTQRILDLKKEGILLKQMAVLFRAHYQSLELEMELNKRNIPYVMRGGLRFFEQAHIKDVVAYLKILHNFKDEISWQRILNFESGIGSVTASKIFSEIAKMDSLEMALNLDFPGKNGWENVKNHLKLLLTEKELPRILETILLSGYDSYLKDNYENYQDRLNDLEQLVIFSKSYDSLSDFLSDVTLAEGFKGEQASKQEEALTLSTIHQAKGLEWPVVFVIGLVDGQFPGNKFFARETDIEEERRLFYVAVTRAQDKLYLTFPSFDHRLDSINEPSQFLRELPKGAYKDWQDEEADEVVYVDEDDVSSNFWERVRKRRGE